MIIKLFLVYLFIGLITFSLKAQEGGTMSDKQGNSYKFENENEEPRPKDNKTEYWGNGNYYSPSISKTDEEGNKLWQRILLPDGKIWLYYMIFAGNGDICIAGTLSGKLPLPLPISEENGEAFALSSDSTDEGNVFLLKLGSDGKLKMAVLLESSEESYRVNGLSYKNKKTVVVKTEIRLNGSCDSPHTYREFTVNSKTGKIISTKDEPGENHDCW